MATPGWAGSGLPVALWLLVAWAFSGCSRTIPVSESYGTSRDPAARRSLNGTSVLAGMARQRGMRAVVSSRVTPRIEKYDAVVWFGQPGVFPDPEVRSRIDIWLGKDPGRLLVFVGWDHDAAASYWDEVASRSAGASALPALRKRAGAMARSDAPESGLEDDPACWWFRIEYGPRTRISSVKDSRRSAIDTSTGQVELGRCRLVPRRGRAQTFLSSGDPDAPVAFWANDSAVAGRQVLVISNGSFLLNGALLDSGARQLAGRVLDELAPEAGESPEILWLTSGPVGWSDQIWENETAWSWINQPPLNFVVPHFIVLGVCFLFALLPVLGRRRKLEADLQPGFARHLEAVGQLAARKADAAAIESWRRQVEQRSGRKSSALPFASPTPPSPEPFR
jgi:hypothetical protein